MLITIAVISLVLAYAVIKHLLVRSGLRYLVDSYGLDSKKLELLNKQEMSALRSSINQLRKKNDAFGLEELLRRYRP
jgi:hypothetical protein